VKPRFKKVNTDLHNIESGFKIMKPHLQMMDLSFKIIEPKRRAFTGALRRAIIARS